MTTTTDTIFTLIDQSGASFATKPTTPQTNGTSAKIRDMVENRQGQLTNQVPLPEDMYFLNLAQARRHQLAWFRNQLEFS